MSSAARPLGTTTNPVDLMLSRLTKVKREREGWTACCPAHEDSTPSLSIRSGRDGRVLLKCHAGCTFDQVVSAAGLERAAMFPPKSVVPFCPIGGTASPTLVQQYDYCDANGKVLFQSCRYEPGFDGKRKSFKQRRRVGRGRWTWGLGSIEPVIYRLPDVIEAVALEKRVYIVEGEKDADALVSLGAVATTNPMGAEKWKSSMSEVFRGATDVVVIADNDDSGRRHQALVAESLVAVGAIVRTLELPDLPPKGDTSDWLAAGGTLERLGALADSVEQFTTADPPRMTIELCDVGNGQLVVANHGAEMRYIAKWKGWHVFEGGRWIRDDTFQVERFATDTILDLKIAAEAVEDRDARKRLLAHVKRSLSNNAITAMLQRARAEPRITISHEALDANPMLLNTLNCTIDLETGQARPHDRADLLTKRVPIEYDETATAPMWNRFLLRVMGGDPEMVDFLQRAVGYSLTGNTSEQALFFFHGPGANGKSVFLETLHIALGDYAAKTAFETFLEKRFEGGGYELADLVGTRFVAAAEVGEGRRLNEPMIKALTGSETISARRIFQEPFRYLPQFKLWLAGNHRPVIKGTDLAIWRRIKLVPFAVTIPEAERDRDLQDKLRTELSGILRWAVTGCLLWQKHGLQPPEKVNVATLEYRRESDVLGAFLNDCCELDERHSVRASALYTTYAQWG